MNEYRVTKYNPTFRDQLGHYARPEWIMFKGIGKTYSGVLYLKHGLLSLVYLLRNLHLPSANLLRNPKPKMSLSPDKTAPSV